MAEQKMKKENLEQNYISPEVQSDKELALIQELVTIRKETNRSLEYEKLSDYRMPPRTHFAMLKKPAVSIKYGRLTFNMAAIRLFEGTVNILPMVHEGKHRLAAVPCTEEESASVEWSRKNIHGKWLNKEIRSEEFVNSIFEMMGWDPKCRYKVLGRLVNSDRGLILVFDLDERICFEKGKQSVTNPETGEVKQKQIMHYPDYYNDHIGRPYNEYEAERKMNQFENTGSYSDAAAESYVNKQMGMDITEETKDASVGNDGSAESEGKESAESAVEATVMDNSLSEDEATTEKIANDSADKDNTQEVSEIEGSATEGDKKFDGERAEENSKQQSLFDDKSSEAINDLAENDGADDKQDTSSDESIVAENE